MFTILLPYVYHIITRFANNNLYGNIICMTYITMSGHAMVPAVSRGELRGGLLLRRHGGGTLSQRRNGARDPSPVVGYAIGYRYMVGIW